MGRTSLEVKIWKVSSRKYTTTTTYRVRREVGGRDHWKPGFDSFRQADNFRMKLIAAQKAGEEFDVETGKPVSMLEEAPVLTCFELAVEFVDFQWSRTAATTRPTTATALMYAMPFLLVEKPAGRRPDPQEMRKALVRWGFNTKDRGNAPAAAAAILGWVAKNTRQAGDLAQPEVARVVLEGLGVKLDGKPGAPSVSGRRRRIFGTFIEYGVERKAVKANPIPGMKWKPLDGGEAVEAVDPRTIPSDQQVADFLRKLEERDRAGRRLVAYFACIAYALMRPSEAQALTMHNLLINREAGEEWSEFLLDTARPWAGKEWTDSGEQFDEKGLKQRKRGAKRPVPCSPELAAIVWAHIDEFGLGPGDRLFVGDRNKDVLPKSTINKIFREIRAKSLPADLVGTDLMADPYSLRHYGVSAWLNRGEPATRVAEVAGHSLEVLQRIYAHCGFGGEAETRARMRAGHLFQRGSAHTIRTPAAANDRESPGRTGKKGEGQ